MSLGHVVIVGLALLASGCCSGLRAASEASQRACLDRFDDYSHVAACAAAVRVIYRRARQDRDCD